MACCPASRIRSRCQPPSRGQADIPGLVPVEEEIEGQEEAEHDDGPDLDQRVDDRRGLLGQPTLDLLDDAVQRRGRVGGQVRGCELRVQSLESEVEVLRQIDQERDQREGDEQDRAGHDQDRGAERPTRGLRTTPATRSQALVERPERRRRDQGKQDRQRHGREVHRRRDDEDAESDRDQDAPTDGGQTRQPAGHLPGRWGRRRVVRGRVKRHPLAIPSPSSPAIVVGGAAGWAGGSCTSATP